MKTRYYSYILNIVLIFSIILFATQCQPEEPEVKIETEYIPIELPQIKDSIPEVHIKPTPIIKIEKEVDSVWYRKYHELKSQTEKDSLYNESIKENEYLESYEDDKIKIDVFTKTRGEILEQNIPQYIVKPKTVVVPHTTITKISPPKIKVYGGLEIGLPTKLDELATPIFKGNIFIQGKKENIITLSIDSNTRFWVGKVWKF